MTSFKMLKSNSQILTFWPIAALATGWLILISALHLWLNYDHGKRKVVTMGYMPVVTNLAAPILDHISRSKTGIRFKGLKFSSFAEMAEALRNGRIQVAFMIAPLAIVLRQQGEDVKIVYIGNRHESTLVTRKELGIETLDDLVGKTLAVPMRYSGHNLSILKLMEENGFSGRINVVEMNPPDMASALATGSLDAYYVGEPFAAQTLKSGDANRLYYVEELWENFICNLVLVRQSLIEDDPDSVGRLVQGAVRSGIWARQNPEEAARIATRYWNQPVELIEYALTTPKNRIVYDRFVPQLEELQHMSDLMVHFNLAKSSDIAGLIEDRFAKEADLQGIKDVQSILSQP